MLPFSSPLTLKVLLCFQSPGLGIVSCSQAQAEAYLLPQAVQVKSKYSRLSSTLHGQITRTSQSSLRIVCSDTAVKNGAEWPYGIPLSVAICYSSPGLGTPLLSVPL